MAKEIELKLGIVDAGVNVLAQLDKCFKALSLGAELEQKPLFNIYYDTPEKVLNQHRMALRVRKKGGAYIQTLKTKGKSVEGLSQRGEWEWSRPDASLDLACLQDLDVWPKNMNLDSLMPAFETNFVRHQAVLKWKDSEIELAYDQGEVLSGGRSLPIFEIELELISGEVEALKSFAKELEKYIDVKPADVSKAERGYSLLSNE